MKIRTYYTTNVGKVRKNNEDAYYISKITIYEKDRTEDIHILIVLDGMGGLEGGELASSLGGKVFLKHILIQLFDLDKITLDKDNDYTQDSDEIDSFFEVFIESFGHEKNEKIRIKAPIKKDENNKPTGDIKFISNIYSEKEEIDQKNKYYKEKLSPIFNKAIDESNRIVNGIAKSGRFPPGTTLTAGTFFDNKLLITNIGDSRAYQFKEVTDPSGKTEKVLRRISKDHSFVQELVDKNVITSEQARFHPQKNVIMRNIGVDKFDSPDNFIYNVNPDDIYLLSSDGLHDLLSDKEIGSIINKNKDDIENVGKELVEKALEYGGYDNITIIVANIYE
jgi:PPM family protein phosphatase